MKGISCKKILNGEKLFWRRIGEKNAFWREKRTVFLALSKAPSSSPAANAEVLKSSAEKKEVLKRTMWEKSWGEIKNFFASETGLTEDIFKYDEDDKKALKAFPSAETVVAAREKVRTLLAEAKEALMEAEKSLADGGRDARVRTAQTKIANLEKIRNFLEIFGNAERVALIHELEADRLSAFSEKLAEGKKQWEEGYENAKPFFDREIAQNTADPEAATKALEEAEEALEDQVPQNGLEEALEDLKKAFKDLKEGSNINNKTLEETKEALKDDPSALEAFEEALKALNVLKSIEALQKRKTKLQPFEYKENSVPPKATDIVNLLVDINERLAATEAAKDAAEQKSDNKAAFDQASQEIAELSKAKEFLENLLEYSLDYSLHEELNKKDSSKSPGEALTAKKTALTQKQDEIAALTKQIAAAKDEMAKSDVALTSAEKVAKMTVEEAGRIVALGDSQAILQKKAQALADKQKAYTAIEQHLDGNTNALDKDTADALKIAQDAAQKSADAALEVAEKAALIAHQQADAKDPWYWTADEEAEKAAEEAEKVFESAKKAAKNASQIVLNNFKANAKRALDFAQEDYNKTKNNLPQLEKKFQSARQVIAADQVAQQTETALLPLSAKRDAFRVEEAAIAGQIHELKKIASYQEEATAEPGHRLADTWDAVADKEYKEQMAREAAEVATVGKKYGIDMARTAAKCITLKAENKVLGLEAWLNEKGALDETGKVAIDAILMGDRSGKMNKEGFFGDIDAVKILMREIERKNEAHQLSATEKVAAKEFANNEDFVDKTLNGFYDMATSGDPKSMLAAGILLFAAFKFGKDNKFFKYGVVAMAAHKFAKEKYGFDVLGTLKMRDYANLFANTDFGAQLNELKININQEKIDFSGDALARTALDADSSHQILLMKGLNNDSMAELLAWRKGIEKKNLNLNTKDAKKILFDGMPPNLRKAIGETQNEQTAKPEYLATVAAGLLDAFFKNLAYKKHKDGETVSIDTGKAITRELIGNDKNMLFADVIRQTLDGSMLYQSANERRTIAQMGGAGLLALWDAREAIAPEVFGEGKQNIFNKGIEAIKLLWLRLTKEWGPDFGYLVADIARAGGKIIAEGAKDTGRFLKVKYHDNEYEIMRAKEVGKYLIVLPWKAGEKVVEVTREGVPVALEKLRRTKEYFAAWLEDLKEPEKEVQITDGESLYKTLAEMGLKEKVIDAYGFINEKDLQEFCNRLVKDGNFVKLINEFRGAYNTAKAYDAKAMTGTYAADQLITHQEIVKLFIQNWWGIPSLVEWGVNAGIAFQRGVLEGADYANTAFFLPEYVLDGLAKGEPLGDIRKGVSGALQSGKMDYVDFRHAEAMKPIVEIVEDVDPIGQRQEVWTIFKFYKVAKMALDDYNDQDVRKILDQMKQDLKDNSSKITKIIYPDNKSVSPNSREVYARFKAYANNIISDQKK